MSPSQVLDALHTAGALVLVRRGQVVVLPPTALTPTLKAAAVPQKAELIALIIREYEAEWERVTGKLWRMERDGKTGTPHYEKGMALMVTIESALMLAHGSAPDPEVTAAALPGMGAV